MKRIVYFLFMAFALLAGVGCKKTYDYTLDQQVSAVSLLYAPADSLNVTINPSTGPSIAFRWSDAKAADGSLVQYELAFSATADFKQVLYTLPSDAVGTSTTATVTQVQLNTIAAQAGIQPLGTGTLYWTVYSTKGLNLVKSTLTRMITLTRPAGFANPPSSLYLTGSATEGGTDLSKAILFKSTGTGSFELYTSLKTGSSYQFVDKTSGTPTTYYVDGPNLKEGGSTNYSDTTAQVRFDLDFTNGVANITVIRSVDVWYAINDQAQYHLTYNGNSTWVDANQLIVEPTESWGPEQRYKFRFTANAGGGTADYYEWYGSSNSDNNEPTSTSPASYFYLTPVTSDQWNNCYKFQTSTEDNKNNTITVSMQASGPYTHTVVPQ